jgi:hypothetical protein
MKPYKRQVSDDLGEPLSLLLAVPQVARHVGTIGGEDAANVAATNTYQGRVEWTEDWISRDTAERCLTGSHGFGFDRPALFVGSRW